MAVAATERIFFEIDGQQDLVAIEMNGTEALSELFRIDVTFAAKGDPLPHADLIGASATLTYRALATPRRFHGIVGAITCGERIGELWVYRAALVPAVAPLEHRRDCRIFQELNTREIVEQVLADAGIPAETYRFDVQDAPPTREYCVQYRESDWAFVSRLLEQDGVFYYFEHGDDASTLVFADRSSAGPVAPDGPEFPLVKRGGMAASRESVLNVALTQRLGSDGAALRDFNFTQPQMDLTAKSGGASKRESFDYPGGYETSDRGKKLAKIRLEADVAAQTIVELDTTSMNLIPGHRLELDDGDELVDPSLPRKFLVIAARYQAADPVAHVGLSAKGEKLAVSVRCIPEGVPYRPPRRTARPVISGVQTAIVTGAEEIHTDKFGRIKVHFHWDRHGPDDERSSCWLRVAQPWAGSAWGAIFLPRRGDEVIVDFAEGDPDRPLVTGRVYNGDAPPPYGLPAERTKSTIRTHSSPDGTGFNELRFEDLKDSEEVYLHAQRDLVVEVENDASRLVRHDETIHIEHDRTITVDNNLTLEVGVDKATDVKGKHTETIGGDAAITVRGNETYAIDKDHQVTVSGARTVAIKGDDAETVDGKRAATVHGAATLTIDGKTTITLGADLEAAIRGATTAAIDGAADLTIKGDVASDLKGNASLKVGGDLSGKANGAIALKATGDASLAGMKTNIGANQEIKISCGAASITLKASGEIVLSGVKIAITGAAEVKVQAPKISTM